MNCRACRSDLGAPALRSNAAHRVNFSDPRRIADDPMPFGALGMTPFLPASIHRNDLPLVPLVELG
jgi:hypothetical protein